MEFEQSPSSILFVAGEDAVFLPNVFYDNVYVKVLTSLVFGYGHYPTGTYSLYSCSCKVINVFLSSYFHIDLINRIIANILQDYIIIKLVIWAQKNKNKYSKL